MPSASSCLLHVFCFAETQCQTESKRDKKGRRFFWNIYDFWEVKSKRNGVRGGHEVGGRALPPRRAPDPRGPPVRRLTIFFCRKKANFTRKIWAKVSPQSELRISLYKRNGEGAESRNAKKQREIERYIQSRRGSRPSQAVGAKDQRGNPSPI